MLLEEFIILKLFISCTYLCWCDDQTVRLPFFNIFTDLASLMVKFTKKIQDPQPL